MPTLYLGRIEIGSDAIISQHVYLCAGTHDYTKLDFPLIAKPVRVEDQAWVTAGCFVAPGVTIGRGAIIGAHSVVLGDMPAAMICAGNPARPIKSRPYPGALIRAQRFTKGSPGFSYPDRTEVRLLLHFVVRNPHFEKRLVLKSGQGTARTVTT